jgi:flagellar motor component MotA
MFRAVVGWVVFLAVIVAVTIITGTAHYFIDLMSLMFVGLGIIAFIIAAPSGPINRLEYAASGAVTTGWIGFAVGLVITLRNAETFEATAIAPALSVMVLPVFYGYVISVLMNFMINALDDDADEL